MLLFFFNDTATTEIYTRSLHDALPIWLHLQADGGDGAARRGHRSRRHRRLRRRIPARQPLLPLPRPARDRKSTRLNSSHANMSYAVFCLKTKTSSTVATTLRHKHSLLD